MFRRIAIGGVLAAAVGATMLALSAAPASAFTLSSPALDQSVAGADIQHVWWDRWGNWHPNRPYWGPGPGWGPGYYPYRRCWRGRWGRLHCRW